MNALAQELLVVCKRYLGPAAPAFLHRQLRDIGTDANRIETRQLDAFAEAAMLRAEPLMGPAKAAKLRTGLLGCGMPAPRVSTRDHQLASEAASGLLARGNARGAVAAYRELVMKDGDIASYRGLADALLVAGDRDGAVAALRDGAAARLRANDRASELELLAQAVVIAPVDLVVHRRLAAALANHGDLAGACVEYRRFIDVVVTQGDSRRARLELAYARELLGELPDLLAIVDRLAAGSAPEPRRAVDEARPAPDSPSVRPPAANEPIDFQKAALRRRFRDRGVLTAPRQDVEASLAALVPSGPPLAAAAIAYMRATVLIDARDLRAGEAALDAARRLLTVDRPRAAADILLAYVNAGFAAREAHLVLAEAVRRMGRPDIAEEKCRLVATLHRLDGDANAAGVAESAALAVRAPPRQHASVGA